MEEKRYSIKCPKCDAEIYACKSLGMRLGFAPWGFGTCINCKAHMALIYNYEADTMQTEDWDVFVEKNKKESEVKE